MLPLLALGGGEARAALLLTQKEALALAFPAPARAERRTAYLSMEQRARAQALARAPVESLIWTYYVGASSAGAGGYAYFDRVVVRTMPAAVMAALDAEGRVRFVEMLTFDEPEDYLPRKGWLRLFSGAGLDDRTRIGGALPNVVGATLTSHALAASVRRMLAVHRVLHGGTP